jgi:hypothetical protein
LQTSALLPFLVIKYPLNGKGGPAFIGVQPWCRPVASRSMPWRLHPKHAATNPQILLYYYFTVFHTII